jgi:histidine triad (HIT) family protein
MKTIFQRIIEGELPAETVYEDETIIAIKDKHPQAPVHLLIIPKKMIEDLQSLKEEDLPLMGKIVAVAQLLAKKFDLTEEGYRLLVNNGPNAGQIIYHLHFHLLGGRALGPIG